MKQAIVETGSQEHLSILEPQAELWGYPGFQDWVTGIRKELKVLKELPWRLHTTVHKSESAALLSCGLHTPRDTKEMYETFLAVKAVVEYFEGNLRQLESQSLMYHELLEEIQKREGKEDE